MAYQSILLKKILRELKLASFDENPIRPVEHSKKIKMLAYSYYLGALIMACPKNKEEQINPKNKT
ncbi:13476_t:CDS:2, partial [Racocetra persica]